MALFPLVDFSQTLSFSEFCRNLKTKRAVVSEFLPKIDKLKNSNFNNQSNDIYYKY